MWGQWAISAREILKFPLLAYMSFLLVVAANADVDADASNGSTPRSVSSEAKGPTTCVDLNADCSTLMINYYGDSVQFALFRRYLDVFDGSSSRLGRNRDDLPEGQ